jgi:1-deoxy-D-xylulose-5-phosphate reductoisomerase
MIVPNTAQRIKEPSTAIRQVSILGSTGSIGTSALEFIGRNPDSLKVHSLVAGRQVEKLAAQILKFQPKFAAVPSEIDHKALRGLLEQAPNCQTEILFGAEAINEIAAHPACDVVLAAIVGSAGLPSIAAAIKANKLIALANKESLVCAGALLSKMLAQSTATIIPVDSEHSAIFQLLEGQCFRDISSVTLTASGGPFLNLPKESFGRVTPEQAVKHPRWNMGAKISVDSATLVNKALEVIEAHWLFDLKPAQIEVVIHPQSIIHAMINFCDGSRVAHLSVPDMIGPISFALDWPGLRSKAVIPKLDLVQLQNLEFFELNDDKFPAVALARTCLEQGGIKPALLNIANEVAVEAFLAKKLGFDRIIPVIEQALGLDWRYPSSVVEYCALELEMRETIKAKILSN